MARTGKVERFFRVSPFHHCASDPPARLAGMFIQGAVPRQGDRHLVVLCGFSTATYGKRDRIQSAFSGVQTNNYWSGSTNASNTSNAWNVNLDNGNVNNNDKTNSFYVWPVRGGE